MTLLKRVKYSSCFCGIMFLLVNKSYSEANHINTNNGNIIDVRTDISLLNKPSPAIALDYRVGHLNGGLARQEPLPSAVEGLAIAQDRKRVYVSGGNSGLSLRGEVYSGLFGPEGLIGAWRPETSLPMGAAFHGMTIALGRVYVVCVGSNTGVYSAPFDSDGIIQTWREENSLSVAINGCTAFYWGNRLYVISSDGSRKIVSAGVTPRGTLGSWRNEINLPDDGKEHAVQFSSGRLYVSGGISVSNSQLLNSVYSSVIGDDGFIQSWETETPLPRQLRSHSMAAGRGRIFISGGQDASCARTEIWSSSINSEGQLDLWVKEGQLPEVSLFKHSSAVSDGLLILGGIGGSNRVPTVLWGRLDEESILSPPMEVATIPNGSGIRKTMSIGDRIYFFSPPSIKSATMDYLGNIGELRDEISFTSTTASFFSIARWNKFIYAKSSENGGGSTNKIRLAKVQQDGSLSTWTEVASFPASDPIRLGEIYSWNGYLYLLPNIIGTYNLPIQYASIRDDGSLDPFTETLPFPYGISDKGFAFGGGRLYIAGGHGANHPIAVGYLLNLVYSAQIRSNGSLEPWYKELSLPFKDAWLSLSYSNRQLDVYSNDHGGVTSQIDENGHIVGWEIKNNLPTSGYITWGLLSHRGRLLFQHDGILKASGKTCFSTQGSYLSPIIDLGNEKHISMMNWDVGQIPAGSSVKVSLATSTNLMREMSPYTTILNGLPTDITGRFVQYKVELNAVGDLASGPIVNDLSIKYDNLSPLTPPSEWVRVENKKFRFSDGIDFIFNSLEGVSGKVDIYTSEQNIVRTLNFSLSAGVVTLHWDGKDEAGNTVFSDVFTCVFATSLGERRMYIAGVR